jgi:hypothetical protein
MVLLECATCDGPIHKGLTLAWPASIGDFDGTTKEFTLRLHEKAGWLKDSHNSLVPWSKPSQCDIIQTLSRLSVSYCRITYNLSCRSPD